MQNLHNTIFCQISATEDIIYPFYQHNPPQETPQMFRKFRWAFSAHSLTVEQWRPQICGGVDLGIFICSAGQRREWRNREKQWLFNENDNVDVNYVFFAKVSVVTFNYQ